MVISFVQFGASQICGVMGVLRVGRRDCHLAKSAFVAKGSETVVVEKEQSGHLQASQEGASLLNSGECV